MKKETKETLVWMVGPMGFIGIELLMIKIGGWALEKGDTAWGMFFIIGAFMCVPGLLYFIMPRRTL